MSNLDVLRQPADTLAVTLSHDNTAHEDLDGPDALKWDLALACSLVEAKFVAELVLGDGVGVCKWVLVLYHPPLRCFDGVESSSERGVRKKGLRSILLPKMRKGVLERSSMDRTIISCQLSVSVWQIKGQSRHTSVELGLALGESLGVLCVYEEDDAGDFREVLCFVHVSIPTSCCFFPICSVY